MTERRPDCVFKYRPTLRPAPCGGIPSGIQWDYVENPRDFPVNRPDLPPSRHRFGIVALDRKLTESEVHHFDLEPVD
jgi:hypothetical protein